jgi:hypothetical protein
MKWNLPCSPGVHASGASTRAARCAGQYPVAQRQHHPIVLISPLPSQQDDMYTYHSQILKRSRLLNIPECLLQIFELLVNHTLGLLSTLDGLHFERLNRLNLAAHIVRRRLEGLELLLNIVNDGRVLQLATVRCEVDGLGQLGQLLEFAAGVVVALFEGDEGVSCVPAKAELAG